MASDPEQAVTLEAVSLGGKTIPAHTVVWVWSRANGHAEIECGEKRGRVAEDVLSPYPVKGPGVERLRRLEPCFGLDDDAFVRDHLDQEHYFELLRCKAHGARFLRDTRGTVGWYSRLTLLRDDDVGNPGDIWSKYHGMSETELLLEGRTL
jgi:hypothetical protein